MTRWLSAMALVVMMFGASQPASASEAGPGSPDAPTVTVASPTVDAEVPTDGATDDLRTDLVAPDAESATAVAAVLGVPVENGSAADGVSAEYVLPSGLTRVDQYIGEQFAKDDHAVPGPEQWRVISPYLVAQGSTWVPESYSRELALSGGGPAGVILRAAIGESGVVVEYMTDFAIPAPRIEGPRAVYANVRPGVDFVVDVRPSGFEQYFVLHDRDYAARSAALDMDLHVYGGTARSVDGAVKFFDGTGNVVGILPDAFAWDATNDALRLEPVLAPWAEDAMLGDGRVLAQETPVTVATTPTAKGVTLHLVVDRAWLNDSTTTYPVVVDPVVHTVAQSVGAAYPGYTYTGMLDTRINSAWLPVQAL